MKTKITFSLFVPTGKVMFQLISILLFLCGINTSSFSQSLVFSEYFNDPSLPANWYEVHDETVPTDVWVLSETSLAGGSPYELHASPVTCTGTTRLVLPPVNSTGYLGISINFRQYFSDLAPGASFKIQTSMDGANWADEAWSFTSGSGSTGPETVFVPLANFLGYGFYISFVIEGDFSVFNEWYLDDVELFATLPYPVCPSLIYPPYSGTNISNNFSFEWEYTWDATGYLLYFGTDYPPTNILNGQDVGYINTYFIDGLQPSTQYYWAVIPYDALYTAPSCTINNFTTLDPVVLPFYESFDTYGFAPGWSQQSFQPYPIWNISESNYAGGDIYELASTYTSGEGESRLILPPVNTNGLSQVYLSFSQYFIDYAPGLSCKIQTSADMLVWNESSWVINSGNGDIGPQLVNISLTQDAGSTFYVSFVLSGDHSVYYGWNIDNISLNSSPPVPDCSNLLFPPAGSFITTQSVNLQWESTAFADGYYLNAGTDYPPSNLISNLDVGSSVSYILGDLLADQQYFWSVTPYNTTGMPAGCPVNTFSLINPFPLPFAESFDDVTMPAGWSQQSFQENDLWFISEMNIVGDAANEIGTYSCPGIGETRLILPPLSTVNYSELTLRFNHAFNSFATNTFFKVQTSSDLQTWNESGWAYSTDTTPGIEPEEVIFTLQQDIGNITYISFVISGDHGLIQYWFLDDIAVYDSASNAAVCTQEVFPADSSVIFTSSPELIWNSQPGAISYLLYAGSDNPPTNVINGELLTDTTYVLDSLSPNLQHYWKVVPCYSEGLIASGCPVWSFYYQGPVTQYPWVETFDQLAELPTGWQSEGDIAWFITSSSYTGPEHDHTSGTGKFALVQPWKTDSMGPFLLETCFFDITSLSHPKLNFFYQIGCYELLGYVSRLHLDVWNGNSWVDDVVAPYLNNISWEEAWVDLLPYKNDELRIRFRVMPDVAGMGSEVALDDLMIVDTIILASCPVKKYPVSSTYLHKITDFRWNPAPFVTGYLFYLGTDNPPTNIINGLPAGTADEIVDFINYRFILPYWDTTYYWNVIAFNGDDTSSCSPASFQTMPDPTLQLPVNENFINEGSYPPWSWFDESVDYIWWVEDMDWAGGDPPELVAYGSNEPFTDTARLIMAPINTQGSTALWLTFKHLFYGFGTGVTIKVQTSSDLVNWTDEFQMPGLNGYIGPRTELVKLLNNIGDITYIAFNIEGELFNFYSWNIDDIHIFPAMEFDAGVLDAQPENNFYNGFTYDPIGTVFNYSEQSATFTVTMSITDGYSSTVTVTNLGPGEQQNLIFDPWSAQTGTFTLHFYTSLSGDQWSMNDTAIYTLVVFKAIWTQGDTMGTGSYRGCAVAYQPDTTQAWLYAIGGNDFSNTNFSRYDVLTDTWTDLVPLPFGVELHAAAITGDDIYVITGMQANGYLMTDSVRKYDIPTATWSIVAPLPSFSSNSKAVSFEDSLIYVAGGYKAGILDDVWLYNTLNNTWREASPLPAARFSGAFSRLGNTLFYTGGWGPNQFANSTFIGTIDSLDHSVIHWQQLTDSPLPEPAGKSWMPSLTTLAQNPVIIKDPALTAFSESNHPQGGKIRWDAAPWGDEGFIVTTGSWSYDWSPTYPNPCYIYHISTDTWEKMPNLPVPVSGSFYGSFYLGNDCWKLIVASGYDGWGTYTGTQILTDTLNQQSGAVTLSGYITYVNTAQTALGNCTVQLMDGQNIVMTTTSAQDGFYQFSDVSPGNYTIKTTSSQNWGGGNAVDALLVLKHFTGMAMLQGLKLEAANTDLVANVNAVDALQIVRRFVGQIINFPLPDWIFETPALQVGTLSLQQNIKGICSGDVDGSFQP